MSSPVVVLVSNDEEIRSSFRSVLDESPDLDLAHVVSTIKDLVAVLDDDDVDVVVIDSGFAEVPVLDTIRNLAQSHPFLGTIVLSRDDSASMLTSVIEAGARALISTPLSLQDVQVRVDNAATWSRSLRQHVRGDGRGALRGGRGRIITVAGAKGGSGTTVITTLLGMDNVSPTSSICLVDLDLRNGHLGFYTGVSARRSVADLADVASELTGRSVREVVNDVPAGFAVLTAPENVERAEDVTGLAVRQILSQLRSQFEVVLVDLGCTLDEPRATALEMADESVLVVGSDVVSLRAGRRVINSWERLSLRQPEDVKMVVNRASREREVQPELAKRIVKASLVGVIPDALSELEGPINTGALTSAKPATIGKAIRQLSVNLGLREGEAAAPQSTGRKSARLSRRERTATVARAGEAGQAMVELPVMVFIFLTVFLMCLQGLAVGAAHIFARHAATEVAREASVGADRATIDATASHALPLSFGDGAGVSVDTSANRVQVTVHTPRIFPVGATSVLDVVEATDYQPEPQ